MTPTGDSSQPAIGSPYWNNGAISGVTLIPGSGYAPPPAAPPAVTFSGDGTGALGTAVVAPDGSITSITIDNGGSDYTTAAVTIAPPPPNIQYFSTWSNDQTSTSGSQPTAAVTLPVVNGLYSVQLGDTAAGMSEIPPGVFHGLRYLRVWFSHDGNGFQQLTPDQPLATAPYAFHAIQADTLLNPITSEQLADGSVTAAKLANGSVGSTKLASGAISHLALNTGATPPVPGQILSYTNIGLRWASGAAGLTLPYDSGPISGGLTLPIFRVQCSTPDVGTAIEGTTLTGNGVRGISGTSNGVYGFSNGSSGIYGTTNAINSSGVEGSTGATNSAGVSGISTGTGPGVRATGILNGAVGLIASSQNNDGIVSSTSEPSKSAVVASTTALDSFGLVATSTQGTGVWVKTERNSAPAGFFWNSAGGEALRATGQMNLYGQLYLHSTDMWFGHSSRLGAVGRALVDGRDSPSSPSQLHLNFDNDWDETVIGGGVTQVNTLRTTGAATIAGNLTVQGMTTFAGGVSVASVFGDNTISYAPNMLVCGSYNDPTRFPLGGDVPLLQVGNGTSGGRSNAFTVLTNGDSYVKNRLRAADVETAAVYAGNVYAQSNVAADKLIAESIDIDTISAYKLGGGVWLPGSSDARFKDVESVFQPGLSEVSRIRTVRYRYKKDNPDHLPSDVELIGVIAQEIQAIMPEAVITRPDGFFTVDLNKINWAVLNAVKELKEENDSLKLRLEAIEAKLK